MSRHDWDYRGGFSPYISVTERRRQATKKIEAMKKLGKTLSPVQIEGRMIARTFWGKAWCDNLESYSDFSNRLPRGRTYVRNGSVIDLQIGRGEITALVSGSSIYQVKINIRPLEPTRWKAVIDHCSGQIDSLIELLQGKFSRGVMEVITCPDRGLFPAPTQIALSCSCPDSAVMCKHVAAALYGVGARLDDKPELFFQLRNVDQAELITSAGAATVVTRPTKANRALKTSDLSGLFGIELSTEGASPPAAVPIPAAQPSKPMKKLSRRKPLRATKKVSAASRKTKRRDRSLKRKR